MASTHDDTSKSSRHNRFLGMIKQWAEGTSKLRSLMERDYEFVNGIQAKEGVELKVKETGRELLYFNEIRPQYELLSGYRVSQQFDYVAEPRSREDKRYSTIVSALLKGTYEVGKKNQQTRRVGDDGDACGLGAIEIGHTTDYAEDVVWGDVFFERISPFSFVWDVWGTSPHFQDGMYMGKRWWMPEDTYRKTYGEDVSLPDVHDDWLGVLSNRVDNLSDALRKELLVAEKKHVAVYKLYYKEPTDVYLVADAETGDVYIGGKTEEEAKERQEEKIDKVARERIGELQIVPMTTPDQATFAIMDEMGQAMVDPNTGEPLAFATADNAQAFIDAKIKEVRELIGKQWKIFKRRRMKIKWVELSAFDILDEGELPETTQKYPFRVYVSRHIGDNVDHIEGIVRQVIDRQREITKRYNHLADHLAHSAHSGFFNKKNEGADPKMLQLMGARPGIVVDYLTVMPTKIEPAQIPVGHFTLLEGNISGMQRGTGMNAEMLGFTSTSTVSGEAIDARQRGGFTMQLGRITNYQEFEKEVAEQTLYQIQESMPVDKMRRMLGVWEARAQSQIMGVSVFLDPITGEPVSESQLLSLLSSVKNTQFDLTLKPTPTDQSTRDRQYMKALQAAQLVTQTGRPIGPTTFEQLLHLSDLPEMLIASLRADAIAAAQAAQAEAQGAAIGDAIKSEQARRGPNA